MTGLDKILNQIKDESSKQVSNLISEAEKNAAKVREIAKTEAEAKYAEICKTAEDKAEDLKNRAKASGELAAKQKILAEKQQIILDMIIKAQNKLESLTGNEYFSVLGKMAEKFANGQSGCIILAESDKKNMTDEFKKIISAKNLSISEKTLNSGKGFILDYGDIEENCTFGAIFESSRDDLSDKINAFIFGKAGK